MVVYRTRNSHRYRISGWHLLYRTRGGPTQWTMDARGREYNYTSTRSHNTPIWSFWSSGSSGSSSSSGIKLDSGDDFIGVLIIIIVVVLIIAALTIPHFWVTATIILCFLLMVLSMRDMYPSGHDPMGEEFHE